MLFFNIYFWLSHIFPWWGKVLIPYEITLLSNTNNAIIEKAKVLIPYEITLLSNYILCATVQGTVLIPYENTLLSNFESYSTDEEVCFNTLWNYTTLKQTTRWYVTKGSFNTLWNYTTLKLFKVDNLK